ncbi:UNKNOWN [Stylonychia lemnae]|uniref:Uncharacterized protein n=1 Tax=Stylonychia lemnae TaxID=5949 RepID=A0A077ZVU9_STYLE|nr:UNKNOWN [Stylonychia lemnae]|eukprot:CDW73375.1 UNKNOWN [Stylonychia lemnae]
MEGETHNSGMRQFKMLKPKVVKRMLEKGMGPGITSVVQVLLLLLSKFYLLSRLFCNVEGSIIAKTGKDDKVHSEAAVLANICHEYIEFGTEAFKNNTLQTLFITTDNVQYVAKPIYNLILCFICTKDVNLGLIKSKLDVMAECLEDGLKSIKDHLVAY